MHCVCVKASIDIMAMTARFFVDLLTYFMSRLPVFTFERFVDENGVFV